MVENKDIYELGILNWWIEICDNLLSGQLSIGEYCSSVSSKAKFGSIQITVPGYYAIINQLAYDAYEYTPSVNSEGYHEQELRIRVSFANDAMKVLRGYILHTMES